MTQNEDNLSFTQTLRKNNQIITDIQETTTHKTTTTENELPILIIPNTILLPHTDMTIQLDKAHTENMLQTVNENHEGIILTPKGIPQPDSEGIEFYDIGVILQLKNLQEEPDQYQIELKVKDKVFVTEIREANGTFHGVYYKIPEESNITEQESIEINKNINDAVLTISNLIPNSEIYAQQIIGKLDTQEKVAEVFPYIRVPISRKQELLEMESAKLRALKIVQLLIEQKDAMLLQMDIAKKLNKKMSETHKQSLLREQMKMIQEELNLTDETEGHKTYREKIKEAQLPEEVEKVALEELHKLERQGQNNSEENIIRNYLDTILSLPWHKEKGVEIDITKAKEQLDKDHYGLKKVKERIIQHLTVLKMKEEKQGSILLLVGPPGTGKTSLGRSIAEALDRPYIRASLGGIKDESEIRGHRRTYLGALPGRIINGMKKAGKTNPVFVLDEIDKMTASINGNPTSALLEVLDPEQNDSFSDHYLEVPYDLSDVFFIGTANSLEDIPGPLRDRLEIIKLDSYTKVEKEHIAEEHLIDEVLEDHGLTRDQLTITPETITVLIEKYTREAGVRNLKRQIEAIARHTTEKIIVDQVETPYTVTPDMLYDILGHEKAHYELVPDKNPAGVVTGLAWTPVGGDILYIEAALTPGEGKLKLTGKLGDVMKESAQIAQSLIRSRFSNILKESDYDKHDIHIHVPEGAIPKDGPSAGITMTTTLASLITGIPVDSKIAMTGEISLTGRVLPVGGIKEKVIAAHRSGIKKILLPKRNMKDLDDVPEEVKNELTFKPMNTIEEVLTEALNINLPHAESLNIDVTSIQQ
ncbi:endopeptidase La [Methanosphaera sp. ISO3-F5]|uniref:endopeptidase La n=1 Tax=Methanosphaera sp. ISO3-F5 TaxID=1452353 RepID=UPI002B258CAB|nr:endopeptidase La [Methanosphaera sp. ISO3-F5]WQH64316.1 endopeptidase La [Methanosphaera sp. ISO3-F5]